jgi:hypothetical protein
MRPTAEERTAKYLENWLRADRDPLPPGTARTMAINAGRAFANMVLLEELVRRVLSEHPVVLMDYPRYYNYAKGIPRLQREWGSTEFWPYILRFHQRKWCARGCLEGALREIEQAILAPESGRSPGPAAREQSKGGGP